MRDWVASVVGKPYLAGASGPEAYDCLGLVRAYFRDVHGKQLPDYHLNDPTEAGLAEFIKATQWRIVSGQPVTGDVMTMESHQGKHVGIVVRSNEGLGLLHAAGKIDKGSVCWQPLDTLIAFRRKQLWRA